MAASQADVRKSEPPAQEKPPAREKPPANYQDVQDSKTREMERKAPTTRSTMGRIFKAGGYVRAADGIAQRGKTKGRMC